MWAVWVKVTEQILDQLRDSYEQQAAQIRDSYEQRVKVLEQQIEVWNNSNN